MGGIIRLCSWCNRPIAYEIRDDMPSEVISHGICQWCKVALLDNMPNGGDNDENINVTN